MNKTKKGRRSAAKSTSSNIVTLPPAKAPIDAKAKLMPRDPPTGPLSEKERTDLANHLADIRVDLVGALRRQCSAGMHAIHIREHHLDREYPSFSALITANFSIGKSRVYQCIDLVEICNDLIPELAKSPESTSGGLQALEVWLQMTERCLRPLKKFDSPVRKEVRRALLARADKEGGMIPPGWVNDEIKKRLPPKEETPQDSKTPTDKQNLSCVNAFSAKYPKTQWKPIAQRFGDLCGSAPKPETRAKSFGDHIEATGSNGAKPAETKETAEFYNLKQILPKEMLPAMITEIKDQSSILLGTYLKLKTLIKKLQIKQTDQWGNENTVLEGQEQDGALKKFQLPTITYQIHRLQKIVFDPEVEATRSDKDSAVLIADAIEVIEQQCEVLDDELYDIQTRKDNLSDDESIASRLDDSEERAEVLGEFLDRNLDTKDLREALEPWQDADLSEL